MKLCSTMEERNLQVKLHCLFREQLYHSASEVCNLTDTSFNVTNTFYRALALLFTNKAEEALNLLSPLHIDPLLNLSAILASIHIHKHFNIYSESSESNIPQLEASLRSERKPMINHSTMLLFSYISTVGRRKHENMQREH